MKNLSLLIIFITSLLYSQSVTWKKEIPFESADDGPVGIDVDANGNIFVACYSNGPNESEWIEDGDSLLLSHSPDAKIIKLDSDGNIFENRNFGILFNHEVEGIGITASGYKLIGSEGRMYNRDLLGYRFFRDVWLVNIEEEIKDTLKFVNHLASEFVIGDIINSDNSISLLSIGNIDTDPGGGGIYSIYDLDKNCFYRPDSIVFPDSLQFKNKAFRSFGYEYIFDFRINGNELITCGGFNEALYEGYTYIMKTIDYDTAWEEYKKVEQYGYASVIFYKVALDINGDFLVNIWDDLNGNHSQDENEYFIRKYSSDGILISTSDAFKDKFLFLYNIGPGQYIAKIEGESDIIKFTDTGSELSVDWVYSFNNAAIVRPISGGFITAGTDGSNIIVQKIDSTTGIEENTVVPNVTKLHQNYPNPFNPCTKIWYTLNIASDINLSVFNSKGELVKTLFEGKKEKGLHKVSFDASELNSGIYFYKLTTENGIETRKMLFLR